MRLFDADDLGIGKANPEAFIKPEYAYGWNAAIEAIKAAPIIDAVPVEKMELQQFSIDTRTRMAKAVFRFGDKRITLCRDCGELAPVVHGRWETNNDPEEIVKDFSCSVCEELLCDFDTYDLTPGENCFYYCPNCGAKMDGGNDAENH